MKTGLSWIMMLVLGVAIGSAAVRDTYDEIKTTDGVSYKSCTVTKIEPDGLTIIYSDGALKVPFAKLSASLQQKYHYDPAAAATYQSEQEAKKKAQLDAALKASASAAVTEAATPASAPVSKPAAESTKAVAPVKYRYDAYEPILREAESDSIHLTLKATDAFSLSQLEDAKKKAVEEHKPLGFVMMWDTLYNQRTDLMGKGSVSAAAHFYYVFRDQLVLIFVRHEDELDKIPEAVKQGFFGPDEGGFAPNLCVTDAAAQIYVCEIPYGGLDNPGRTKFFRDGFVKIRAAQAKWDEEAAAKTAQPTP